MNEQSDPFVGKVIDGRYEILTRIGEGGMGVVYKCKQISIDRIIAIKMLNAAMAGDPTWVQRFYNEAKACSRLQHPNTIRMFDFGQEKSGGRLFMTMEFLDGISLRAALQNGPLAPQRVAKILIQCCASLAEAHSIGIIHRDIKPDNVFLLNMAGSPDFVKLLDFSVAKLLEGDRMKTQAGVVFGTPQYMSPEQGRGLPLDARSDLYALGILAWEMLSGTVPFHDENPMTVIQMHLRAEVPPLPASVPYAIQQIVRRALEKDAARRYQSSGEMMQHCQQVFGELAGGASIGAGGMPRTAVPNNTPQMMQPGFPQAYNPQLQHNYLQQNYAQQAPQQYQQPQTPQQGYQQQPYPQVTPQGGYPQQGYPQQAPQMSGLAPQQGYVQSSAAAKTMISMSPASSPFQGGMPAQQMGYPQALPAQKTIVAGIQPGVGQMLPAQNQMMPQGTPGGYAAQPAYQNAPTPNKTVALQASDGIVSAAQQNAIVPQVGGQSIGGASTMFWIVSMFIGVAIGVLAYVIVLQAS